MLKESQSAALISQVFDDKPESVVWFKPILDQSNPAQLTDLQVQYANPVAGRIVGVPRSEFIGTRLRTSSLFDPETIALIFTQCREVWESGKSVDYSYYSPGFDRYFHVQRSRVGEGILSTTLDRTQVVQDEIQAEQDRGLLAGIINASINGLFAVDAVRDEEDRIVDFRFLTCNDKFLQLVGKAAEEIIGKRYLPLFPTSQTNGMFDMKCQVIQSGESIETEFFYQGEGIDGWFQVSIAPLGKNGAVETFTDITESKRDKENLARSAEQFRTVVDSSKAGMFTLIPVKNEGGEVVDFRFRIVNQAVAAYIGQTAEVLTGSLASVYFPAYTTNGLFDLYKDNYLSGKPYNFDFHYEDGYDVFFNIDVVKMGDEVLVTFTDHTILKRLQREQEKILAELKRSNESLAEFTSAASHDLKEPMRKVQFFTERLKEKLEDRLSADERRLFERVETASARMRLLVDDLLAYSHVNHGNQEIEAVDLNEMLQQVQSDLELVIAEKQATIKAGHLPIIKGYPQQVQQLFHNLLGNALKYSQPGVPPLITITSVIVKGEDGGLPFQTDDPAKPFHLINVQDNGIGFEQQFADKIFHIFTRLHGNSEYAGSGIGLAIVKKVAEHHGGKVMASGYPGQGARFSIFLPAEQ